MVNSLTGWGNDNIFDVEIALAPGTRAAPLSAPAAAGVQGGVPAMAWVSERGIEVQFFSAPGEQTKPAEEVFSRVLVSPGTAKSDVQIADARLAIGVAWQEESDTGLGIIKLRGVPPEGLPFGTELIIGGDEGDGFVHASFNNHCVSISRYNFATNVTVTDPADTIDVTAKGFSVAWVASEPGDASGFGRIMLQRYQIVLNDQGDPVELKAAGLDGQNELRAVRTSADNADLEAALSGPANDNAIWVGDEDEDGIGGAIGRDPAVAGLHTGDTLVAWFGMDGHVHARLYPPDGVVTVSDAASDVGQSEYDAVNAALSDLTPTLDADDIAVPDGPRRLKAVELGSGSFAIMWVVAAGASYVLQGTIFSTTPDNPAGTVPPRGWTNFDIAPIELHAGFTGEFNLTGLGEDNASLLLTYTAGDGSGTGIYTRHINASDVARGGQIGQASPDFLVTATAGDQSGGAVAGMIGDRAIITYLDQSTGKLLTCLLDTRAQVADAGGGLILRGGDIVDRNGNGVIDAGDRISARPDVLVGTSGDDLIIGDLLNPNVVGVHFDDPLGADDQLFGGLGNDVIFGGGGNDIIDGGRDLDAPDGDPTVSPGTQAARYTDVAIYQGSYLDYAIWLNGDGSYSVLEARFDDGRSVLVSSNGANNSDGLDLVSNVETYEFLNNDTNYILALSYPELTFEPSAATTHQFLRTADLYQLPDQDQRLTGNVPAPTPEGTIGTADSDPAGIEMVLTPVGWAETQAVADNGFKMANSTANERKPIVKATEEAFIAAWQVGDADAGPVSIKLSLYDPLGAPTEVATGGTVINVADDVDGRVSPAIAGIGAGSVAAYVAADQGSLTLKAYDFNGAQIGSGIIVDSGVAGPISEIAVATYTVEVAGGAFDSQFCVAYVQGSDAQGYGNVMLQSFGALVFDGVPQLPVALARDGTLDGADAPTQLVVAPGDDPVPTDSAAVVGRGIQAAGLRDGQLAVVWIEPTGSGGPEVIRGAVIQPTDGSQILRIDLTDLLGDARIVEGTKPMLAAVGEGDILVSWLQVDVDADSGFAVMAAHYKTVGPDAWMPPEAAIRLQEFASLPLEFSVSVAGETDVSVIVTWREGSSGGNHDLYGQRFDIEGNAVGKVFDVTGNRPGNSGSQGASDQSGAAGMLDGRFVVLYTEGNGDGGVDVEARIFDTRSAEVPSIGRDAGGLEVGTVFDDIIDGRDGEDALHGGLGKDLLIGGVNNDVLFGGTGDDTLIGGTGTDSLDGGDGNDLLMGSHGRDYIKGGDGEDTISYRGEARAVEIDLAAGWVKSDAAHNAVVLPTAAIQDQPAGFDQALFEDIIGYLVEIDHEAGILTFVASQDVENAEGGLGNDIIHGDDGANVLTGGGGDDVLNGRAGGDTAILRGSRAEYIVDRTADGWRVQDTVAGRDGTDTLIGIEYLNFLGDNSLLNFASFQALDDHIATAAGEPVLIDVPGSDMGSGRSVVQIGGVAVSVPGTGEVVPSVAVDNGFVQLRADGSLLFTPDNDFSGPVDFSYTIRSNDGAFAVAQVHVDVKPDLAPTEVSGVNVPTVPETNSLSPMDTKVGNAVVVDDGVGTRNLSLSPPDTGRLELVGTDLNLKAGVLLDAQNCPTYSITVRDDHSWIGAPGSFEETISFSLNIKNANDAPTDVSFTGGTIAKVDDLAAAYPCFSGADRRHNLAPDDTHNGNSGNDNLDGAAGKDSTSGGAGNDTYVVDVSGEKITQDAGQGIDTVLTPLAAYTFGNNVEDLSHTGTGAFRGRGNDGANTIEGSAGANQLQGDRGDEPPVSSGGDNLFHGGDDKLSGRADCDTLVGGKHADTLAGHADNDKLTGGNGNDMLVFRPGFGNDAVNHFGNTANDRDVIDLSSSGFATFDALQAAGALAQVGADVVITLNPADPVNSDKITLRSVTLSALEATDFKFS